MHRKQRWSCTTSSLSLSNWTETSGPNHRRRRAAAEDPWNPWWWWGSAVDPHPIRPCVSPLPPYTISVSPYPDSHPPTSSSSFSSPTFPNIITGLCRASRLPLVEYTVHVNALTSIYSKTLKLKRLTCKLKDHQNMSKTFW